MDRLPPCLNGEGPFRKHVPERKWGRLDLHGAAAHEEGATTTRAYHALPTPKRSPVARRCSTLGRDRTHGAFRNQTCVNNGPNLSRPRWRNNPSKTAMTAGAFSGRIVPTTIVRGARAVAIRAEDDATVFLACRLCETNPRRSCLHATRDAIRAPYGRAIFVSENNTSSGRATHRLMAGAGESVWQTKARTRHRPGPHGRVESGKYGVQMGNCGVW